MTLAIQLEIGHDASIRNKTTPEGFTHDWEVFVRGCGGAEIHHYIEKVVFHLHETFQKPRRVVKEPPFSLRTSGYAGFTLPIEIYLKNNQEPKKILFSYELVLQPSGPPVHNVQKEKYVFHNPSDEFRSRLLKGGALVTSSGTNQENSLNSNKIDDRNQMTSKPRLSGSDVKKHKMKLEEPKNSDFLNLFGPPITKTSKSLESNKPKEPPKPIPKPESKTDKEKEKSEKSKSAKSSHKDREKDKDKCKERSSTENNEKKNKDDKKKSKDDKSKERERNKDKPKKERDRSPRLASHSPSPKRSPKRSSSPPSAPSKAVLAKEKDYYRDEKKDKEEKRDKKEDKKTKKDKRDHKEKDKHKERDKEKEHKDYKNKEIKPNKEVNTFKSKDASPNSTNPTLPLVASKVDKKEKIKDKESSKESPKEEERIDRNRTEKFDDKSQKHKHKKKDKKEKREERYTKSDKKSEKHSNSMNKFKEMIKEPSAPIMSNRENDKSNLFGSPKSEPSTTPDQETVKTANIVPFKDDDYSVESTRGSSGEPSPIMKAPSRTPSPMEIEPIQKIEPEKVKVKEESPKKKEKKEKKKDKRNEKDHERKRKRKNETVSLENGEPLEKSLKEEENNNSDDESKVSSTEDINPIPKSECDMDMLRDLQHKIMSLKDNADLQKVVQLIAETGQYEVSANTFDFDLCLLDRSTVKQLQDFFATVS